jgi:predicted dienelactone hydrolase
VFPRAPLLISTLCVFATAAQAAGLQTVQIPADETGPAIKALVWTPCAAPPEPMTFGPYVLPGVRNCPIQGEKLPLIVLSHGHGGNTLGHHDTAETLADSGFVVVALDHPGDTHSDMSRAGDISVLAERPLDVKRVIDFMLGPAPQASKIDRQRIGFFGFSRGGYTGLVLAGGDPDFIDAKVPCPDPQAPICGEIARKEVPAGPLAHDPRIKAFVIADPLNFFPTAESLKDVRAPIQLWRSEKGGDGVVPETISALVETLPQKPEFHIVVGAAHFAFLAPCPAEMVKSIPEICVDGAGFDRAAFHKELDDKILAFFKAHLAP